jgi:hypothetical protein
MKWPWKMYFFVVAAIILTVAELGFIAPALISSSSDEGVLAGVVSLIIYIPAMFYIVRALFTKNQQKQEEKEND